MFKIPQKALKMSHDPLVIDIIYCIFVPLKRDDIKIRWEVILLYYYILYSINITGQMQFKVVFINYCSTNCSNTVNIYVIIFKIKI